MPKAVEYELRCDEERIRVGNHSEIVIGYRVDFAMVVPLGDCYIDVYDLPKERFVQYDQTDGPWLEFFGKAKPSIAPIRQCGLWSRTFLEVGMVR